MKMKQHFQLLKFQTNSALILFISTLFVSLNNFLPAHAQIVQNVIQNESPSENAQKAIQLRRLFVQLVKASSEVTSEIRIYKVKEAFAQNPQILKWFAEGDDIEALILEAELPELPGELKEKLTSVKNVTNEIVNNYNKIVKNTSTLFSIHQLYRSEIPVIIGVLTTLNPNLAANLLQNMAKKALIGMVLNEAQKRVKERMLNMTEDERIKLLYLVDDKIFLTVSDKINNAIEELKFSESAAVKMLQDPKSGIDLSNSPEKIRNLFEAIMKGYYDHLAVTDKRNIIIDLLELPLGSTDAKKLGVILTNSGPVIQKLFQLIGNDVKSPMLASVMNELKSNIKPFDGSLTIKILKDNYGYNIMDRFLSFNQKPLAAASVGQVHLAKLKNGKEIIVKFLRPGIHEKAEHEVKVLKSLSPDAGTKKIIERLEESLLEELDFTLEGANMKKGHVYKNPHIASRPIGFVDGFPYTKNVLVMERALGQTINKVPKNQALPKAEIISSFFKSWLEESLFYGGFFHADLHAGNIFFHTLTFDDIANLKKTDSEYVSQLKSPHLLTLIDFGSVGDLNHLQQKSILRLIIGTIFASPTTVLNVFKTFDTISEEKENELSRFLVTTLTDEKMDPFCALASIISKAIEMEISLPKDFLQFNRGRLFLEKQLADAVSEIPNMTLAEKAEKFDLFAIYKNVFMTHIGIDVVMQLLDDDTDLFDEYAPNNSQYIFDYKTRVALVKEYFIPTVIKTTKKVIRCSAQYLLDQITSYLYSFTNTYSYSPVSMIEPRYSY
jgi:predicted unusual protein kinase regulating ubiquinone biosynthesis (AarF/ABC1/UbiB family)